MALYAIADLHLSLGTDKPMDVFRGWENYVERLEKNWRALVTEEDTVVIAGDISWGMRLEETGKDFAFIESLPGKKLLLKGNHDYWWSTRNKIETFFAQKGFKTMQLVFNSAERGGTLRSAARAAGSITPKRQRIKKSSRAKTGVSSRPKRRKSPRRYTRRVPALPAGVRYRTVPGIAGYDADIRRKGVLLRAHSRRSRRKKKRRLVNMGA